MLEPRISTVICTHNRADYLGEAIDSLLRQKFDNFEVIVVDNASKDATKQVVESRLSNSRLRYVYEEKLGLNNARNRGVAESQAAVVAYLDDDAVATPHWLSQIAQTYQENPEVGAAGGKIWLEWPKSHPRPDWLSDGLAESLGHYDLGDELQYIKNPGLTPRGLNYSLRKDVWEQVNGFDPGLDRSGKNLLSNGDLYMTQKIMEAGWKVAYLPQALVMHKVLPDRVNRQWFIQRGWWQGISAYNTELLAGKSRQQLFRSGSERLLRGLVKAAKYFNQPDLQFENLLYSYGQVAYIKKVLEGEGTTK